MATYFDDLCVYPPLPQYVDGTPRDRILAALRAVGPCDLGTAQHRSGLEWEQFSSELATLLRRGALFLTEDRRGYALLHSR